MIRTKALEQGLDLVAGDSENKVDDAFAVADDAMEVDEAGEKDIWSGVGERSLLDLNDAFIDLNDPTLFYDDYVPSLLTCMSSSSTAGASPADASVCTAIEAPPLDHDDLNNVIENLSYIDLVEPEAWDPSNAFVPNDPAGFEQQQPQPAPPAPEESHGLECFIDGNSELAGIFIEWLNHNRGKISTDDMRTIKIRRDTIEDATRRLGTDVEGKKYLLRLILSWVEHHQLNKNQALNNPNPTPNIVYGSPSQPQVYLTPVEGGFAYSTPAPVPTFVPVTNQLVNGVPYDPAQSWPMPQYNLYPYTANVMPQQFPVVYGNPNPNPNPNPQQMNEQNMERLTRIQIKAATTKEARKYRMARQREAQARLRRSNQNLDGGDEEDEGFAGTDVQNPGTGNQQNAPGCDRPFQQGFQVWRPDHRCMRFLMQKVLKQSDVGTLGRIVLPKKEAERHLPELRSGEGISITMEDIGTSQMWSMRYRFWPNNKSRMYLLENTGDFVRANGLQEGDFIVLYKNARHGKYMIRGIKVRQPFVIPKAKKPAPKKNARKAAGKAAGNASSSNAPIRPAA